MDYILKLIDLCPILSKTDDIMIYIPGMGQCKGPFKVDDIPYWMLMRYVKEITYTRVNQTSNFALCIHLMEDDDDT